MKRNKLIFALVGIFIISLSSCQLGGIKNSDVPSISSSIPTSVTNEGTSLTSTTIGSTPQSTTDPTTSNPLTSVSTTGTPTSSPSTSNPTTSPSTSTSHVDELLYDDLSINFLEFGNYNAGDSVFIKAGDIDILIDAGSKVDSLKTIDNFIDKNCDDGVLEYVIATHAHEDHIACFDNKTGDGIFYRYEIKNIIDFSLKNTNSNISKAYISKRNELVSEGTIHHTADYYFTKNTTTDKYEPNSYNHIELTDTISMDILYNYYYFNKSSDENNYSVSVMINQGENNHFMFTGDLEQDGETKMANYYASNGNLPHVKLFKGGHHGSKTSSNEVLLSQITPEICAVCCCVGSDEYSNNTDNQFPTQDFINHIAKYTTNVFVTSVVKYETTNGKLYPSKKFESLNGIITVRADGTGKVFVKGSNNTTKLKDSEWFNMTIMRTKGNSTGVNNRVDDVIGKVRTWPTITSMYTTFNQG